VERAIKTELRRRPLIEQYEARIAAAVRARELAQLERLQAKYGVPTPTSPVSSFVLPPVPVLQLTKQAPVQISLF